MNDPNGWLNDPWGNLTATDWRTWIGHAFAGFAITVLVMLAGFPGNTAILCVFVTFVYREVDDAWAAHRKNEARDRKVVDGFLDLVFPVMAAIFTAGWLG